MSWRETLCVFSLIVLISLALGYIAGYIMSKWDD